MNSACEIAKSFYETPALVSHRVRCGKPDCRCGGGTGHWPDWFPRWREGGIHCRGSVRCTDLLEVRVIVERRRADTRDVGVTPP
jgi:hypothetical protein